MGVSGTSPHYQGEQVSVKIICQAKFHGLLVVVVEEERVESLPDELDEGKFLTDDHVFYDIISSFKDYPVFKDLHLHL